MNRNQLARLWARLSHRSHAQAADEVDVLVYRLLKEVKLPYSRQPKQQSSAAAASLPKEQP